MKLLKRILCLAIVLATMMSMVLLPIPASAADAEMEVIGAAITIRDGDEGTRALRFVGRIKKESTSHTYTLTYGDSANFGLILIPQYMVNANTTIATDTEKVLTIPAKLAMEYNHPWIVEHVAEGSRSSAYVYFVATIKDIPTNQYKTNFLARVYVNSTCSAQVTRSVYQVAITLGGMTEIVTAANNYGTDIVVDVGTVN